jgi:hypothetical protein
MKQPPPLVRFGTIAFFALMISGAVLYQCGLFEKKEQIPEDYEFTSESDYFQYRKAFAQPWYDRMAFLKLYGYQFDYTMSRTSSIFSPRTMLTKQAVYDLLEMRYETARLSEIEAAAFHHTYSRIHEFPKLRFTKELPGEKLDSVYAMLYIKVGATQLSSLSAREKRRFNQLLNEHSERQHSKTNLVSILDTIQVLRTLKFERNAGNSAFTPPFDFNE